jgi:hypothetical protein
MRAIPEALTSFIETVCKPAGMHVTGILREDESDGYSAARLRIDGDSVVFRVAKTTPTKTGQFVTLWKRETSHAAITPLDVSDDVASVIVLASHAHNRGAFVFSREVLVAQDVMSSNGRGGRRALRVYPPWVSATTLNKQAASTQRWQLPWFIAMSATLKRYAPP